MADSFFGRWSKRKQEVREGHPLVDPMRIPDVAKVSAASDVQAQQAVSQSVKGTTKAVPDEKPDMPLPTMEDVHMLTADSDFAPFVARNVSPQVRNSAMKKLFADPHYNVMDRLDIYIDDYSKPDPLPMSMLRQMASAKFLNLFKEDVEDKGDAANYETEKPLLEDGDSPIDKNMSQSEDEEAEDSSSNEIEDAGLVSQKTLPKTTHDHTDMRLRQDHAVGPHKSGRGTE
ncbi:MAG TPA: DUF3306 domain-containing protein [Burkholderiaceae bacterium]|nr:DUF3306 domain-containing protein [Burkholderiaceae bacterium]